MQLKHIALIATFLLASHAQAQSTSGTLVIVPAYGEVTHANDQAIATFMVEEQDKDKAAAASRVNQKMKQATEIVRKEDPQAILKTQGYYTYPVYPEDRPLPNGMPSGKARVPTSWRVGQQLEVKTMNLASLPKMTAAVQRVAGLSGVQFGLSPALTKKLDEQRIAATYQNLRERIASISAAMGRKASDARLETVDFEGSSMLGGPIAGDVGGGMMRAMAKQESADVAEPSFEPGETTLNMKVIGKVKFL